MEGKWTNGWHSWGELVSILWYCTMITNVEKIFVIFYKACVLATFLLKLEQKYIMHSKITVVGTGIEPLITILRFHLKIALVTHSNRYFNRV